MDQTPTLKEINKLALPAIVAGIAEPLISLVDTAIIGKLGTTQLAAVGIASSFFLLIIWTLSQTKSAISALVSKTYGQNRLRSLSAFMPQAIAANFALGILFFILTATFAIEIFTFYNAKGELLEYTTSYFMIRSLGFPITLSTYAIFGIFRGIQNTKWAMQISLIGGVVNLLFDLLLVFGIEGYVPALGIEGAAWASLIAQVLMFLLAIGYLLRKSGLQLIFSIKVHPYIKLFLGMSLNLFLRTIALNTAYFLGVQFATDYGDTYAAAHTMAINIWLFSAFLIDGYSNAGNAMSGKIIGAGDLKALRFLVLKLLRINFMISLALALIYLIAYPFIGSYFSEDQKVLQLFNGIFWLVIICQPINSAAFTYDGIYKGLGNTKLLRNTLILSTFLGFVPLIFILDYFGLLLKGIWIALVIWMVLRGGLLHFHFRRNYTY